MRTKTEQIMKLQPTGEVYTVDLYEFHELGDAARARIIEEYQEERAGWIDYDFRNYQEHEIWQCVRDLEEQTGARWFYNRFYSCDFDTEYTTPAYNGIDGANVAKDTGYYASFDLCEAWNAHARKINALSSYYWALEDTLEKKAPVKFDAWALSRFIYGECERELEAACADVANAITSLLISEWEDVSSNEYAEEEYKINEAGEMFRTIDHGGRVLLHDSRKWFTADGELYEQTKIDGECLSIVKAA